MMRHSGKKRAAKSLLGSAPKKQRAEVSSSAVVSVEVPIEEDMEKHVNALKEVSFLSYS